MELKQNQFEPPPQHFSLPHHAVGYDRTGLDAQNEETTII